MKAFIVAIIILTILVGGFFINYNILLDKTSTLIEHFDQLKSALKNNDDKNISVAMENITNYWGKHQHYMLIFSNHRELDNISASLIKIKERISSSNYDFAMEEIEMAKEILRSIPLGETAKIENIF